MTTAGAAPPVGLPVAATTFDDVADAFAVRCGDRRAAVVYAGYGRLVAIEGPLP